MRVSQLPASALPDSDDIARLAEDVRTRLSIALRLVEPIAARPEPRIADGPLTEKHVRELIRLRRARDRFFDGEIFADPAWDILLELYASELGQQRITVSSLCIAAAVPPTTALRWIAAMEKSGLITRSPDPIDGRRSFLALSRAGLDGMNGFFGIVPGGAVIV